VSDAKNEEALLGHAIDLLTARYEAQKTFNDYLDNDDPVLIGPSAYPRSKVLYWVDPEAYDADKSAWESDANEAKHEEATSLLSLSEILCVRHTIPPKESNAPQHHQARSQRQNGTAANLSQAA
jgi:hypothetical protein